jgi:dynein heavy chain, axonemal
VANNFLGKMFPEEPVLLKGMVDVCVQMQNGIYIATERFRTEIRRHYYVTPTSYLELINCFTALLGKKKGEVRIGDQSV